MADDLGYSDLGCYGGEIHTPHLDRLGRQGVRLAQFYNTARCSPSRASLLTGLHPHQTGIGILTNDDRPQGYPGTLNRRCVTLAEILGAAGYATCLAGKWHLAAEMREPNDAWPTRRGFDRFFGTLTGCGSYFHPGTLTRGETNVEDEPLEQDFYYTDAITDEAVSFVQSCGPVDELFLLVAYTAPHWPLHARPSDMARYDGAFASGWDELRDARMRRLLDEGVVDTTARLSERDPTQPAWSAAADPEWQAARMQAYAAQVDRLDQGVGRLVDALRAAGRLEDTLIIFLSDNGASDESLPKISMERFRERSDIVRVRTRDGRDVRIGNEPAIVPGPEDTYASYGRAWANLSNVPFRFYKRWVHEGGIATPFILHWPAGQLAHGAIVRTAFQLTDVVPTVLDALGLAYPREYRGQTIEPAEGRSMLAALRGEPVADATLFWEHTGNAAIRRGQWKLVREYPRAWELYDLSHDRSEIEDLAAGHADVVQDMAAEWQRWAERVGVIPWEVTLDLYASRALTEEDAAG